jgi:transposase
MARPAQPLSLTPDQRRVLEAWRDAPETPRQVRLRARIILLAAAGGSNRAITRALQSTLVTVLLWRKRFMKGGTQALMELAPGRGPGRRISKRQVRQIVETTRTAPPGDKKRWSVRRMAQAQGVSQGTVQRIWDEYGLKPHLAGRLKPKRKAGRLRNVVGLYLNPPDQVLALAFDRVPRHRPSKKRGAELPESLTSLLGALGALEAMVVGDSRLRPRQQAFLGFLRRVERAVPDGSAIHLVVDREGTHTESYSQAWLKRRRHFHLHPAPAGSTWFRWAAHCLGELSRKRGTFPGVGAVEQAVQTYLAEQPSQPRPFAWPGAKKQARSIGRQ